MNKKQSTGSINLPAVRITSYGSSLKVKAYSTFDNRNKSVDLRLHSQCEVKKDDPEMIKKESSHIEQIYKFEKQYKNKKPLSLTQRGLLVKKSKSKMSISPSMTFYS